MNVNNKRNIAVIGLGYVGLPVAQAFSQHQPVIAFDIHADKIQQLQQLYSQAQQTDQAGVVTQTQSLVFTSNAIDLKAADFYVICVPTPVDTLKHPDLSILKQATETVAQYLKQGDIVVFESTVYPGATEEECVPILEKISGLRYTQDFNVGYSPERINPGDSKHTLENIVKVVSGSTPESLQIITQAYEGIIKAGVHQAPNIKTAEAAKVIENTQRDLNIALMNELAIIFNKMDINTHDVLKAANTKWNFLPFEPGLVGGHCIGVDPYYLTYQAQRVGHNPEVILAGRNINDSMGKYIATQTIKKMLATGNPIKNAKVGIMGLTFKQDCPDVRNSKVMDIINELEEYGIECLVHDPVADVAHAQQLYQVKLHRWGDIQDINAMILAVSHQAFYNYTLEEIAAKFSQKPLVMDVKSILDPQRAAALGIHLWQL